MVPCSKSFANVLLVLAVEGVQSLLNTRYIQKALQTPVESGINRMINGTIARLFVFSANVCATNSLNRQLIRLEKVCSSLNSTKQS